jgi:hypothetical protein
MVAAMRTFEDSEAKRCAVPLMLGLVGPSSSGKTYSALRLATGIQRVTGGDIYFIDTEARRALHYADRFKFRHVPFGAPFGPMHYLAAIEHCAKKGAKVVIVDSMSHEHEGPGGVLELHREETKRLAALWRTSEYAAQMSAWGPPKEERRRMINTILQLPITTIFCFRAKEKLRVEKGKDPKPLGWMAIAGEEFVFEMTARFLLLPGADGYPTWRSNEEGEKETMKRPEQFRDLLTDDSQISEDQGEAMARWASGAALSRFEQITALIREAGTLETLEKSVPPMVEEAKAKKTINPAEYRALKKTYGDRKAALTAPPSTETFAGPTPSNDTGEVPPEQEPPTREPGDDR